MRRVLLRVQQISLVIIVWSLFVGGVYGLYKLVFERDIFVVKDVEVEGQLLHVSESAIKNMANIKLGTNLFSINLEKIRRQIAKNSWIKEAAVARKLPSTIWIYAGEYTPYAIMAKEDLYLVDNNGVVFKEVEGGDEKNLPVFTGTSTEKELNNAMTLLNNYMNSPLADYFAPAEVNFNNAKGYSIIVSKYGMVIRLGFDNLQEKLERLYSMLGTISAYKTKMRYVDLNIPGKVVVKYES